MRNRFRWMLQGLLVLLALEGMALLAVLRGVLPGWQEPLTVMILITALAVLLYESVIGVTPNLARSEEKETEASRMQLHKKQR